MSFPIDCKSTDNLIMSIIDEHSVALKYIIYNIVIFGPNLPHLPKFRVNEKKIKNLALSLFSNYSVVPSCKKSRK